MESKAQKRRAGDSILHQLTPTMFTSLRMQKVETRKESFSQVDARTPERSAEQGFKVVGSHQRSSAEPITKRVKPARVKEKIFAYVNSFPPNTSTST